MIIKRKELFYSETNDESKENEERRNVSLSGLGILSSAMTVIKLKFTAKFKVDKKSVRKIDLLDKKVNF